ncbi:MAG: hypothetical protein JKY53_00460 [Flavobacteriales bacterium]|nr:hypothetical protein [Flavobacteriales bacterium]
MKIKTLTLFTFILCGASVGMAQAVSIEENSLKDEKQPNSVYDIVNLTTYPDTADLPKKYKDIYSDNPAYMQEYDSLMKANGYIPKPTDVLIPEQQ